tara:strand:+ start:51 stop:1004 length:954 start_codon:yes stop_codon:yes gene_type:complete
VKKIFIYNLLAISSIIILLEFSLRIFSSLNELGFKKNLFDRTSITPIHNKNIESIVFGNKVFIDKYGFRVPKKNYFYNETRTNFLVMGDSVSFGVGVSEEETFVGLLRKEFDNFNIFNSSVVGHNIKSYQSLLPIYSDSLDFESVIIFFGLNDIVRSKGFLTKKDIKSNYFLARINVFLRNKSILYIYLKSKITDPEKRYFSYLRPAYEDQNALEDLEKTILDIKNFSSKKNKKLYFVILPYEFQTRKENCNNQFFFPQNEVIKIFENNQINYKNFSKNFCDYKQPKKLFLKFDPLHLSSTGHLLVLKLIQDSGLIK